MKKLFAILLVVAMACSFAMVATADGIGTADYAYTSEGGIKIDVIDDFSSYEEQTGIFNDAQYAFGDGKLVWDIFTGGWNYGGFPDAKTPSAELEGIADAYNNAQYLGFQVKNTGEVAGAIAFEKPSNWALQIWDGTGIKLVSAEGIVDAEMVDINAVYRGNAISVPAGFDGWVFIPFTSFRPYHDANWAGEKVNAECMVVTMEFCGTCVEGEEEQAILEIDNLFLAASLDVDTTVTPPVENPTEAPVETEPADDTTEAPTETETTDNGASAGFPVWIIIVGAVVVVAVIVVIIVASKKKKAE